MSQSIPSQPYRSQISSTLPTSSSTCWSVRSVGEVRGDGGQCASLRQQTADGNQIYAVYLGPYPDQASACSASTSIGNGAYGKQMDATIPPEQTWEC